MHQVYVNRKQKIALELGIDCHIHRFPEQVSYDVLEALIIKLNQSESTHGILIQLPLPAHIPSEKAWKLVDLVDPIKDVDGLHYMNQGKIGLTTEDAVVACTPLGCLKLLEHIEYDLLGKSVTVIGRSRIVGKPLAALLTAHHATVTIVHSKSQNIEQYCQNADLLMVAAGQANMVKGHWIKKNAVVIDVGIHRLQHEDGSYYLCGDVDFQEAKEVASAITPVPGGVGPMTIAGLMNNICLVTHSQELKKKSKK